MIDKKGFTLVELMIAVALAGLVLTGAYAVFGTILTSKEISQKASDAIIIDSKLSSILAADFRQSVLNSPEIKSLVNGVALKIQTHNSLFFQGALPVEVLYYVDENYLVREEKMPLMDFEQKMRLINNADNFTVFFYENGEYHDKTVMDGNIIKITLTISGTPIEAVAGTYHRNTLINFLGIGNE